MQKRLDHRIGREKNCKLVQVRKYIIHIFQRGGKKIAKTHTLPRLQYHNSETHDFFMCFTRLFIA